MQQGCGSGGSNIKDCFLDGIICLKKGSMSPNKVSRREGAGGLMGKEQPGEETGDRR